MGHHRNLDNLYDCLFRALKSGSDAGLLVLLELVALVTVTDPAFQTEIRASVEELAILQDIYSEGVGDKKIALGFGRVELHPAQGCAVLHPDHSVVVQ